MPTPVITLSTDFGASEAYVAMLKGVLLRQVPSACLVDLSHRLSAAAIFDVAWLLRRVSFYYPAGTIHLVGIDDGRGPARVLVAGVQGQIYLAADNEALGLVLEPDSEVFAAPRPPGTTFLARDVLAPLAGRLAQGTAPAALGAPIADWQRLELPRPVALPGGGWRGQVLHGDAFGNLLTNFRLDELGGAAGPFAVEIAGVKVARWCRDYSEAAAGAGGLFLLWGAEGWLEIALPRASAADQLDAARGTEVVLR